MRIYSYFVCALFIPLLAACTTSSNKVGTVVEENNTAFSNRNALTVKQEVIIKSDGVNQGKSAYKIIREALGHGALESPDLYSNDHQHTRHIEEVRDDIIGDYFVMTLHRDLDGNKGVFKGRQRNEIKVYNGSEGSLKGYKDSVFSYHWKMKINAQMEVSKKFTHLFQIKPKGGDDSTPTVTITGAERRGKDVLEIRHFAPERGKTVFQSIPWEDVQGQWLDIKVRALYADNGWLEFTITKVNGNAELVNIYQSNIDMWVGTSHQHYQRPKWGIVRSLEDFNNLRAEEETVGFADIKIVHWE